MINKQDICGRFFSCYGEYSRRGLAKLLGVSQPTVTEWSSGGRVPWNKLKYLSDSQGVSWDWLIDGMEPKLGRKKPRTPESTRPEFDAAPINERFFSLFQSMSQSTIARTFDIAPASVHEWSSDKSRVPWNRLAYAVRHFGVRWDWLLDGVDPKYR